MYKEMLSVIAELENMKLKDELNKAIKFSTQIDGSLIPCNMTISFVCKIQYT